MEENVQCGMTSREVRPSELLELKIYTPFLISNNTIV